ncbi:hypothetical protein A6024_14150 [Rhodovulum sulfidophilum]|uniref:hypothetical protein n=1 Tax=Rhodovulum sulfidophilum TaxID=35806 RepID=UPI0005A85B41|nr:hypothetical protein [Rhodovulum sulfidophilum]ANB35140.1 hypothetical protein A6W98_14285 [Rhodovulum sulfidophilum DSM 1374]ANB38962.1 hypothetical protein A6024_14150 [Rhodovulum sulfidophilum]
MDAREQAEGEKRVRDLLVEPLLRRGLVKPGAMTKAQFEEMLADLAKRLAYMSAPNLAALEEMAAAQPGGKDRDRFPIANAILKAAAQIQPPADDASPLIRAVFAHAVGRQALAEGWAPELLDDLRHNRRWPRSYALGQIRQAAGEALRRHAHLAGAGPGQLSPAEATWLRDREARLAHCRSIADLAGASA